MTEKKKSEAKKPATTQRFSDVAKELGIEVIELEAATAEDRQPNLETLTSEGANPIIAVGFAFGDALAAVAAANPDTQYAIVDGFIENAPANVTFLGFAEQEGSFLVGAAAALACECDAIGFIGGQEIDLIKRFEAGYIAGAKQINPEITVESQYLGAAGDNAAWGSPDKAKEIALGWFADGVEVVYTAAGGSGQGTIEAAVEADKWAIGVDSDQYLTATPEQQEHILTSMLKRVDVAVYNAFKEGTDLVPGINVLDLKSDGVGYAMDDNNAALVTPEMQAAVDAAAEKIKSGELVVHDYMSDNTCPAATF
jgi:basic membrane protein A